MGDNHVAIAVAIGGCLKTKTPQKLHVSSLSRNPLMQVAVATSTLFQTAWPGLEHDCRTCCQLVCLIAEALIALT